MSIFQGVRNGFHGILERRPVAGRSVRRSCLGGFVPAKYCVSGPQTQAVNVLNPWVFQPIQIVEKYVRHFAFLWIYEDIPLFSHDVIQFG